MRLALLCLAVAVPLHAAVIGTSQPAQSITAARIAALPPAQRVAWTAYLYRSARQQQADRAALAAERASLTVIPPLPTEGFGTRSMPVNRDAAFYSTPEALHIAETIVSFQIPSGGWSKNLSMAGSPRLPGQSYAANNVSKFLGPDDFDAPHDPDWNYVGTLDNDATNTELHFLARVAGANPGPKGQPFRDSFLRGLHYLLVAQFPNGGWPQVWPLEGGYHDAITFNDNAVTESASLLSAAATGQGDFAFVPNDLPRQAAAAASHALDCILKTQIILNGHPTIWAQQHDALTLAPVAGRNFEPAALSSGESADLLLYLMSIPNPSPAVAASIRAAAAWLQQHAIKDRAWTGGRQNPGGRHLVETPGAPLLWARYYSLDHQQPIFGDRDKTIHDTVDELSLERRNGYAWYSSGPQQALNAFAAWQRPASNPGAASAAPQAEPDDSSKASHDAACAVAGKPPGCVL